MCIQLYVYVFSIYSFLKPVEAMEDLFLSHYPATWNLFKCCFSLATTHNPSKTTLITNIYSHHQLVILCHYICILVNKHKFAKK